ncbi:hypothetical protein RGR602_PC00320 (plasmid) [Rhizobium gallicum bv. gallicum R602sp]|uniref:Uncharacterized protein n=1 Tax=Rhizobium gallicum bv. gallicum R602sp TaxID=1041138 RepID=A0A0B4XCR1_9HYPH|nr:hypothetical protein RGR602_PC00320 [Rhizobium gallicum bv. gallicum R602sp]
MLSSSSNSGGLRRHINHDDRVRGLATIVREKIGKPFSAIRIGVRLMRGVSCWASP